MLSSPVRPDVAIAARILSVIRTFLPYALISSSINLAPVSLCLAAAITTSSVMGISPGWSSKTSSTPGPCCLLAAAA
ncbi:hypothetical protein BDW68DRAFT_170653 [Aspergillus falconensis]